MAPEDAYAATVSRTFANQSRTTTVFDFTVPSETPSITVEAEWCWEDGGTTGCFTDSRTLNAGYTGPVFNMSKDDGGNGDPGPNCVFSAGRSNAFDYCMDIMGSVWDGQRLILDWEGITDRYLNPSMNRSFLTRISVNAAPRVSLGSAPTVSISASPTTIQGNGLATLSWTADNANFCTATGGWSGRRPTFGVETVSLGQTTTFFIICTNNAGERSSGVTVFVNSPTPSVDLGATPTSVVRGSQTTLSWASENITSCTAGGGWSGTRPRSGNEAVTVQETTAFIITCQNNRGETVSNSVIVAAFGANGTTLPLPGVAISASPTTVSQGGSTTLIWTSSNANSCNASGGWTGVRAVSGTEAVSPTANTIYSISCNNAVGSNVSSVSVAVVSASQPGISLNASPSSVRVGESATLAWSTFGATSCTASGGWSGARGLSGSETIIVSDTTSYSLTCRSAAGERTETITVITNPSTAPVVILRPSSTILNRGESLILSWSATNAITCTASGGWSGIRSVSGSETITPLNTTSYSLTCSNSAGRNTSDNIMVGVQPSGLSTSQAPTVFFTQNPSVIRNGGNSQLSWSTNNANTCYASGGWSGTKNIAGTETVSPVLSTSYTITCSGFGGSVSDSRTVTVQSVLGQSTGGIIQVSKLGRNLSLQNTNLSETIEAQGLDAVEIEIRIKNIGLTPLSTVTIRDDLPSDLLYSIGSTVINGNRIADSISSGGVVAGSLMPGEEKIIKYRAAVIFGTPVKTISSRTTVIADSQNSYGVLTIHIKPRGSVLGAGTVPTGPTKTIFLTFFFGLIGSLGAYYLLFRYRYPGKSIQSIPSDFKLQAIVGELKKKEKIPDL